MTTLTKAQALATLKRRQATLTRLERDAASAATAREEAVRVAYKAGATYADLEAATGLSTSRITQLLRRVRNA